MAANGLIEFGSHTHSHEILTQLKPEELRETVKSSIELISNLTGKRVQYFSYPNGKFSNETINVLKQFNLKAAFTTIKGSWDTDSTPYEIPRLGIGGYDSIEVYAGSLSGVKAGVSKLKKSFFCK